MKTSLPIKITRKSQSSEGKFGVDLVAVLLQTLVCLFSIRLFVSFFRHLTGYFIRAIDYTTWFTLQTRSLTFLNFCFLLVSFLVLLCTEQEMVAPTASGCLTISLLLSAVYVVEQCQHHRRQE